MLLKAIIQIMYVDTQTENVYCAYHRKSSLMNSLCHVEKKPLQSSPTFPHPYHTKSSY